MKLLFSHVGSIVSTILASACCILPLFLASLGLGAVAFGTAIEPYRPVFIAVAMAFLGASFYSAYRRPKGEACAPGSSCSPETGTRRGSKIALWILTVAVLGILAFPYLLAATL